MYTRPIPKRPITKDFENFAQPYGVSGFACNLLEDIILLTANIIEKSALATTDFLPPDYSRINITYQLSQDNIHKLHKFFFDYDDTVTLHKNLKENSITFSLSCDNFLINLTPKLKQVFTNRHIMQPDFLNSYQIESLKFFFEDEFKNYCLAVPKVRRGIFAGLLPRDLRDIQGIIAKIKTHQCPIKLGVIYIIDNLKKSQSHPSLLEAAINWKAMLNGHFNQAPLFRKTI